MGVINSFSLPQTGIQRLYLILNSCIHFITNLSRCRRNFLNLPFTRRCPTGSCWCRNPINFCHANQKKSVNWRLKFTPTFLALIADRMDALEKKFEQLARKDKRLIESLLEGMCYSAFSSHLKLTVLELFTKVNSKMKNTWLETNSLL